MPARPRKASLSEELFGKEAVGLKKESNETADQPESVEIVNPFPMQDTLTLLDTVALNPETLAKQEAALYLEAGNYQWDNGKVAVTVRHVDSDTAAGDIFGESKGRCLIDFSGVVIGDSGRKGLFRFSISPDTRLQHDREGNLVEPPTPDMFTKNYSRCTMLFFQGQERRPETVGEVIHFMRRAMYTMYITLGKNGGNYLNNFKLL